MLLWHKHKEGWIEIFKGYYDIIEQHFCKKNKKRERESRELNYN